MKHETIKTVYPIMKSIFNIVLLVALSMFMNYFSCNPRAIGSFEVAYGSEHLAFSEFFWSSGPPEFEPTMNVVVQSNLDGFGNISFYINSVERHTERILLHARVPHFVEFRPLKELDSIFKVTVLLLRDSVSAQILDSTSYETKFDLSQINRNRYFR